MDFIRPERKNFYQYAGETAEIEATKTILLSEAALEMPKNDEIESPHGKNTVDIHALSDK